MNAIVLISSDRENDGGNTRRLDDDLQMITANENCIYWHEKIPSKHHFIMYMKEVKRLVQEEKFRPILHFHMHGGKDVGLEIGASNEFISWAELSEILREINVLLKNDLCVVSTACHAYNVISEITITKPAPYFCLIAALDTVSFGYIDDNASKFYSELFASDCIRTAYTGINDMFKYFHSEKLLIVTLAKYIIQKCKGKEKNIRKEALLTSVIESGMPNDSESLKELRGIIKEHITPDQALLTRYTEQFLVGKLTAVTIEDILDLVESNYA